jgi:hypothetical protein
MDQNEMMDAFENLKEEAMEVTRAAFWIGFVIGAIVGTLAVCLGLILASGF